MRCNDRRRLRLPAVAVLVLLTSLVVTAALFSGVQAAPPDEPAAWVQADPAEAVLQGELVVAGDTVFDISQTYRMDATAYTAGPESTGKMPGDPAYGITRSGTVVEEGRTVAVDPQVVPLGTWIYIEELGIFRAEDTGGAIQGQRIDVYIEDVDRALSFGYRPDLTVHLLEAAGTAPAW